MDSVDFAEMAAFMTLEPPDGDRIDFGAAQISAMVANVVRRRSAPVIGVDKFVPRWDERRSGLSPEEQMARLETDIRAAGMAIEEG